MFTEKEETVNGCKIKADIKATGSENNLSIRVLNVYYQKMIASVKVRKKQLELTKKRDHKNLDKNVSYADEQIKVVFFSKLLCINNLQDLRRAWVHKCKEKSESQMRSR